MLSIAICDDDIKEQQRAQHYITKYLEAHPQYQMVTLFFAASLELLHYVEEEGGFDLYLLDVYMPGMLGTDAARELRQLDDKGEIIFLTTSRDHAVDAFEVDATQYLVKPYAESALFSALDKVLRRLNLEKGHMIMLKSSEGSVRLFTRDVLYTASGRNNYQIIHTIDGTKVEVRITASHLFDVLSPGKSFIRCGASVNVNLRYIRQITKERIIFDSGEQLSYPYRVYQNLKEQFLRFQMSVEE